MAFAGETIRLLRIAKRQSLQQVADAVGASKAHIWELETGKSRNPSSELLERIAAYFDVSVSHLLGEGPKAAGASPELIAMFRDLQKLDPDDLEFVRGIMKMMQEKAKQKRDED